MRVREFTFDVEKYCSDTYITLLSRARHSPVFPSLTALVWKDSAGAVELSLALHALLVPSLRELEVTTCLYDGIADTLGFILHECPDMQSMRLCQCGTVESDVTLSVPPDFSLRADLRLLRIDLLRAPIPPQVLAQLGCIPSIQELHYGPTEHDHALAAFLTSTKTPFFPALQYIVLSATYHHHLQSILGLIQPKALRSVSILLDNIATDTLYNVISMLHPNTAFLGISEFELSTTHELRNIHAVSGPPVLTAGVLRLFSPYRYLRSITFGIGSACDFEHTLVDVIATSWPELRDLALGDTSQCPLTQFDALIRRPPRLDTGALAALLHSCPRLRMLRVPMPLNCDEISPLPDAPPPPTDLVTLDVGTARVVDEQVERVAALLAAAAPGLVEVAHICRVQDRFGLPAFARELLKDGWDDVNARLQLLRGPGERVG